MYTQNWQQGHYIPIIASVIYAHNNVLQEKGRSINLVSVIIGNGATDEYACVYYSLNEGSH
jgi:carboxypeptidase C (cathepsin A)